MKISILLPYKENFSPEYAGAVSLFVKIQLLEASLKKRLLYLDIQNIKKYLMLII